MWAQNKAKLVDKSSEGLCCVMFATSNKSSLAPFKLLLLLPLIHRQYTGFSPIILLLFSHFLTLAFTFFFQISFKIFFLMFHTQ